MTPKAIGMMDATTSEASGTSRPCTTPDSKREAGRPPSRANDQVMRDAAVTAPVQAKNWQPMQMTCRHVWIARRVRRSAAGTVVHHACMGHRGEGGAGRLTAPVLFEVAW